MDRWSNQDSVEQRFADEMLRREFSLGCGRAHFCQSSALKEYKYLVNQVMLIR